MAITRSINTIYLVSCVKKKSPIPALAKDLYISPWFQLVRRIIETDKALWYILSAKHGLIAPDQMLAPYDQTLNTMSLEERRTWAARVRLQIDQQLPLKANMTIFAGNRYREFIVDHLKSRGANVQIPMQGLSLYRQLSWLRQRVNKLPNPSRTESTLTLE